MSALLDAALGYAKRGWRVFPCLGKRPRTPNGHKVATDDADQICEWWYEWPDANVGLSLKASGLLAIDVDPRNGGDKTLAALEAKHGALPRDCHQRSGGGGEHVVMQHPGGHVRGSLGRGVDVKSDGYIIVAPSRHPESGQDYAWLAELEPPP